VHTKNHHLCDSGERNGAERNHDARTGAAEVGENVSPDEAMLTS